MQITPVSFELGEVDAYTERVGLIGRHTMISFDSYTYIGYDVVQTLTNYYSAAALSSFHMTSQYETIVETSVSTSASYSYKLLNSVHIMAGLTKIASAEQETEVSQVYEINSTNTYTTSTKESGSLDYYVDDDVVDGKIFALGVAAEIYKIECQTWKYDDYWWGDYEVSGSRESFTAYLTFNPFVTIVYRDGTFEM